jgi:hypothetical protein
VLAGAVVVALLVLGFFASMVYPAA